jgi:predicted nucleotidyltransferase
LASVSIKRQLASLAPLAVGCMHMQSWPKRAGSRLRLFLGGPPPPGGRRGAKTRRAGLNARVWRSPWARGPGQGIRKAIEEKPRICYKYPMKRAEAISLLKAHEADLKRLGVDHLYLFGSTVRDDARDDSDVDLFFDYTKGKLGLFELMDVKEYAASILGRETDIMTRDSLHKTLRRSIEESAVRVF